MNWDGRAASATLKRWPEESPVASTAAEAGDWLAARQKDDGHFASELEADATISAELILLNHYLGTIDDQTEAKIAAYLRAIQGEHGGWPLFHGGEINLSATVKAYYALKLAGDDPEAAHMRRARTAVLVHGGAARANVFTRIALALFGQLPWRAVPLIRVEAMFAPRWFPFHIDKVSYWSRTVMVPLFVLAALKPLARNPRHVDIAELFVRPPEKETNFLVNPTGRPLGDVILALDALGRWIEPMIPASITERAIKRAMDFVLPRLNGEDGLGGIFPAMANALMAMDALGYSRDGEPYRTARRAIDKLVVIENGIGYCQPCLSPVWDTGLALHALLEAGYDPASPMVRGAADWLRNRQILDVKGDWASNRRHVRPGGWAFQYRNDYYPDVDDSAVVVMALHRIDKERYRPSIERGTEWILGMQSANGGWGAFDADNVNYGLDNIPFADHGALLDPPTADVTARCIGMLAQLGYGTDHPAVRRGLEYLRREQEDDGSWFGRWGTNHVYGTWSVLAALNAVGEDPKSPIVRRAVAWLESAQRPDGGWGEDCATYWRHRRGEAKVSTPSQTAWAVLGLLAAGEVDSAAVRRGIDYLVAAPRSGGIWDEEFYNAVGFPRVFYLRYHGYASYFPLWAIARYRALASGNSRTTPFGI